MILEDFTADQLRELFVIYMSKVIDAESVSFVDSVGCDIELTDEQERNLRRVERTARHMLDTRDPRLPLRK